MKRGDWLAIANLFSAFICAVAFWKLRGVPALITRFYVSEISGADDSHCERPYHGWCDKCKKNFCGEHIVCVGRRWLCANCPPYELVA